MSSHRFSKAHHASELPQSRHADASVNSANPSRDRVRTYTAHALILSNVYGVLLASGVWFEYYFTSLLPSSSLLAISSIFATQLTCFGLAISTTSWLHHRWPNHWRLYMLIGTLSVSGAHLTLLIARDFKILILCHGALTGLGMGILQTTSLRALSTHYKHSTTTASRLCTTAGFAGALAHTLLSWTCLRTDNVRLAHGLTLALLALTLLPALLLARPCPRQASTHPTPSCRTISATLATALITPTLLIPPLFLPLLLARTPTPYRADAGVYALLALYSTALLSAVFVGCVPARRLSARTLCSAAFVMSGIALVPVVWMQRLEIAAPCAAIYGAGLGCVMVVWRGAVEGYVGGMSRGRFGGVSGVWGVAAGLGAGGGVVGAAALLQGLERGAEVLVGSVAGSLVLAGMVMGVGEGVGRCRGR